jgi:hypothetical protein
VTTLEAKRRREEIGEDNDRATVIFVAAGAAAITVTWAAFLVWVLV